VYLVSQSYIIKVLHMIIVKRSKLPQVVMLI